MSCDWGLYHDLLWKDQQCSDATWFQCLKINFFKFTKWLIDTFLNEVYNLKSKRECVVVILPSCVTQTIQQLTKDPLIYSFRETFSRKYYIMQHIFKLLVSNITRMSAISQYHMKTSAVPILILHVQLNSTIASVILLL